MSHWMPVWLTIGEQQMGNLKALRGPSVKGGGRDAASKELPMPESTSKRMATLELAGWLALD